MLPPSSTPPAAATTARLGVGGGFAGLALSAGGSCGRRLQVLLLGLSNRPAPEPRATASRTHSLALGASCLDPQAPPTPARRGAVSQGKGTGLSSACARRQSRHGEWADAGEI